MIFVQSNYGARRGFTLVELLVVISIIGVLSSLTIVSLNDARAKARDAKRLNDVRQMANVFAIEATQGTATPVLTGCAAPTTEKNTRACTGPGNVGDFKRFYDPSLNNPDDNSKLCRPGITGVCQYSLAVGSTDVENALVLFYLESNIVGLSKGLHSIDPEGVIN